MGKKTKINPENAIKIVRQIANLIVGKQCLLTTILDGNANRTAKVVDHAILLIFDGQHAIKIAGKDLYLGEFFIWEVDVFNEESPIFDNNPSIQFEEDGFSIEWKDMFGRNKKYVIKTL